MPRTYPGRLAPLTVVLTVVLLLMTAACGGGEPTTYGATSAGPTKKATQPTASAPAPSTSAARPKVSTTGAALCKLFGTAEVTARLGKAVGAGVPFKDGAYFGCAWKAGKSGDVTVKGGRVIPTVVTITRAPAGYFPAYQSKTVALARSRRAGGIQEVRDVGDEAFAVGASVKGVPIWYGGTRYADWMTGVEMSGGRTKASVVTVTELLREILAEE